MRIYSFYPNGENAPYLVDESEFGYWWTHFSGKPMRQDWRPPKFSVHCQSRPIRDFVSWSLSAPLVTERARAGLEALIDPYVEFLPFATIKGQSLYAVNAIEVVDCVDKEASEITYAPDEPERAIAVSKFVFDEKKVRPLPIFKVPETMHLFVSDAFAEAVVRNKLTGAGFDDPGNILWVKKPWDRTMGGLPKVRVFDMPVNKGP
jgi:hypothetical protein